MPPTASQRIPICDDEEIIAKTPGAIFAKVGFDTRVAYSGRAVTTELLADARRQGHEFEVLL
jgi:hypothetical protein